MTLTRKRGGRREIHVRECSYIWRIEMEDFWLYVQERDHILLGSVQIFPANHLANQLIVHVSESMLESTCGTNIVTPKCVALLIQGAVGLGWQPSKSGLELSVSQTQEILEARRSAQNGCK